MFAAQFGLLTIWVVLGTSWWGSRLPIAVGLGVGLGLAFYNAELFVLQIVVIAALCFLLRPQE